VIVATAGHIDHGKTSLVKRLTGVDTDRLPEEKARGISIDLGFAYLPVPGGGLIGFVDVPGHERFIRNMLAGVCGIDFALLVVAADDGIMPQTLEHLSILDLLNVTRGAAVVTKIDRVEPARTEQVAADVGALLASTRLKGMPVLPVSAVTGSGLAELQQLLQREQAAHAERQSAGQHFRFAIDRAFSVAGSGTVVTGTVFNGAVKAGDRLMISPAGLAVRVRTVQIQGKPSVGASAGQRCALNLTGAELESVRRGDWVLDEAIHAPTQRLDAKVKMLAGEKHPIQHWTPVHVHIATADVTARIAIRRGEAIPPGNVKVVQLVLDQPVGALHGDRFIVRDQSATRTLGGGTVIDPFPPVSRRRSAQRAAELAALEADDPETALAALSRVSQAGVDLARFEKTYNLTAERAADVCGTAGIIAVGKEPRTGITRELRDDLRTRTLDTLATFHRQQPQAPGREVEALRGAVAPRLAPDVFQALLRELADERKLEVQGSIARIPGHNATSNPADEKLWHAVRPALEAGGYSPPPVRELALNLKIKEPVIKDFLHRKAKGGELYKVTADRFYPRTTLATLAAIARATSQAQPNGLFTAAQYRDATGLGRSLAIEILEFFDSMGVTQRLGDARKMRKDFVPILGAATAPPRAPSAPQPQPARSPQQSGRPFPHAKR
jgi:selenocysteine-specific elongation factor